MTFLVRVFALLAMAAAAQAQIYKSVGPDGKITFTDKPPTAEQAQVRPRTAASGSAAPAAAAASGAIAAEAAAPGGGSQGGTELERGVRLVIGQSTLGNATIAACGSAFASERARFGQRFEEWNGRNKATVQRAYEVAGHLLGADGRQKMLSSVEKDVFRTISQAEQMPPINKRNWCESAMMDLAPGGKSDLMVQGYAPVLTAYKMK